MLLVNAAILKATIYKEVKEARKEQQEQHQAKAKIFLVIRDNINESNRQQDN